MRPVDRIHSARITPRAPAQRAEILESVPPCGTTSCRGAWSTETTRPEREGDRPERVERCVPVAGRKVVLDVTCRPNTSGLVVLLGRTGRIFCITGDTTGPQTRMNRAHAGWRKTEQWCKIGDAFLLLEMGTTKPLVALHLLRSRKRTVRPAANRTDNSFGGPAKLSGDMWALSHGAAKHLSGRASRAAKPPTDLGHLNPLSGGLVGVPENEKSPAGVQRETSRRRRGSCVRVKARGYSGAMNTESLLCRFSTPPGLPRHGGFLVCR